MIKKEDVVILIIAGLIFWGLYSIAVNFDLASFCLKNPEQLICFKLR